MKLTKKTYKPYKGKVYDLTVEESHSYNIEGLSVHNSASGALITYTLGICQADPLKWGLLFERFLTVPKPSGYFSPGHNSSGGIKTKAQKMFEVELEDGTTIFVTEDIAKSLEKGMKK